MPRNPARHPARNLARVIVTAALAWPATSALAQTSPSCPMPERDAGWPKDYRIDRGFLPIVERRHFTLKVEMLISGEATTHPGPDIGYTLNKFPNHHRALNSLSQLGKRLGVGQVRGMDYSVDCFFQRAVGYKPEDTVARLLYAQHLGSTGRVEMARQQLALTANYAGDNPLTHYNIGLVAFDLKDYDRALAHAHRAQALEMPRTELREMLQRQGRWSEPPALAPEPQAPASAAAAASASAAADLPASTPPADLAPAGSR